MYTGLASKHVLCLPELSNETGVTAPGCLDVETESQREGLASVAWSEAGHGDILVEFETSSSCFSFSLEYSERK